VPTTTVPAATAPSRTEQVVADYLPGLEARVFIPGEVERAPLVVMVPGGSWLTADPAGLEGLAEYLAAAGLVAAPVVVRAAEDGVVFPTPVEDVLCAVAFAAESATSNGVVPGPVVVLGHSSGAHLAALAALAAGDFDPECPYPEVTPAALIGMSGTYDVSLLPDLAEPLFGAPLESKPGLWESGNPVSRAGLRPDLRVLLIHGDSDDLVPMSFTTGFAAALEAGGHPTTVEVVAGADHHQIYSAEASGDLIVNWVGDLDR